MKRNASFNLDEIKVRWKKAALENCTGAPCASISAPGPVTNIVASVTSATSVSVSFVPPASTGGSPITGYEATATPTSSAPAKRKSSATITVKGDKSPIEIPGLTPGTNYIFTVVALNAAGVSPPTVTVTPVTPCTLNTATAVSNQSSLTLGTTYDLVEPITIATTTGATGIGTATGLPTGMTATWSNNSIKISGTPTEANTFNYTIPLTGGCGSVNATGTIVVLATLPPQCVAAIQTENTIFQSEEIINLDPPRILFKTIGVTYIETLAIGLPEDMALLWDSDNKYILIYGNSPRILGLSQTFNFSIDLIGPACQGKKAIGEITIKRLP
jgi:hypothetical protein